MPNPLSPHPDTKQSCPPLARSLLILCFLHLICGYAGARHHGPAYPSVPPHSETGIRIGTPPDTRMGHRALGFAYYDADRLYDTVPALFYDDSDFTPRGRFNWNSERYERKIIHTAAVLDSLRMDIVALAGVETEAVVRDLVTACNEDYCYIHRTFNTFDGLDIALLYHGDRFFPDHVEQGRGWLYVEGVIATYGRAAPVKQPHTAPVPDDRSHSGSIHSGNRSSSAGGHRRIGILACNKARYAAEALEDCRENHPGVRLVAAGRFRAEHAARNRMRDLMASAERAGRGNIRYGHGWHMRERILTDSALHACDADVYLRRFLFDLRNGVPLTTYGKTSYRGGYGSLLPVYTYLEQNYLEY